VNVREITVSRQARVLNQKHFCVGLCYVVGLGHFPFCEVGVSVSVFNGLGLEETSCALESNVGVSRSLATLSFS
jgi:hypothetical protein